jgi:uncharacterized protein (TIGR00730 family)
MERLCVFCGSSPGRNPAFMAAARELGETLAQRRIQLVYGGGQSGVMGGLADAVLAAGGEAIGVLPRALFRRDVAHLGLTVLHEVSSLHERKSLMSTLADGFLALPGGLGTMDEWFEAWTWAQLGIHRKPLGLLNVAGCFDPLLRLVDGMVEEGFVEPHHRDLMIVGQDPAELVTRMDHWAAPSARPQEGAPVP